MDLALVVPGAIVAAPIMAIIALIIRLKMGPPVLFCQERAGLHGKPFILYKFRSMTGEKDANGNLLPDGKRLNAFGRFLRNSSLDELPQFWNVLKGDMSLVGPRPLLVEYLDRYDSRQFRRHEAKPGIVGWAGVNGRNANTWENKFELDVWYVDHCSFRLDMKILFMAIGTVLRSTGVNEPGRDTVEPFMGTRKNKD
jgi:sugar transferase EpsL